MVCCGKNKKPVRSNKQPVKSHRKPVRTNRKICPRCKWIMNRVHKYDTSKKKVIKYWLCSNKSYNKQACNFKEAIE